MFEHKEGVFGDHADMKKVESAIKTMQQQCKKVSLNLLQPCNATGDMHVKGS